MAAERRAAALQHRAPTAARYRAASDAIGGIQSVDGIGVIQADENTAPGLRPFDLENTTLTFTPAPEETYVVTRAALSAQADRGAALPLGSGDQVAYRLPFEFRVFGLPIRDVFLSRFVAIQTQPPTAPSALWQYDALEVITQRAPLIAPMLSTPAVQDPFVFEIFVQEAESFVTITWATPPHHAPAYDVRATLFRDGRLQFHYVAAPERPCAVIVTSGAERWRTTLSTFGDARDPAGDSSPSVPPAIAPMLDITAARLSRIGSLDLLRVEIDLAAIPDSLLVGGELSYTIELTAGEKSQELGVRLSPDRGLVLDLPRPIDGFSLGSVTGAARLDGRTLVVELTDNLLSLTPSVLTVTTSSSSPADHLAVPLVFEAPRSHVMTDLSSIPTGGATVAVGLEAFTRPSVSPEDVWLTLKNAFHWSDDAVDAVAIYESFETDIGFFASAYATIGNAGVNGIGQGNRLDTPRRPNLMDMANHHRNPFAGQHDHVLLHEFGHRWLFYAGYKHPATGEYRTDLNPTGAHPAQWVDTRAAFRVAAPIDCSAMGGGVFSPKADGTFEIAAVSPHGFSWFELYLMGLADLHEVDPILWIQNSDPPLGNAYWPPFGIPFVRGMRGEVDIRDVIAAEGARMPAYPATQRRFTIAFVLLVDPSKPTEPNDVSGVAWARDTLVRDFSTATGGRGEVVVLSVPTGTSRRRSAHH